MRCSAAPEWWRMACGAAGRLPRLNRKDDRLGARRAMSATASHQRQPRHCAQPKHQPVLPFLFGSLHRAAGGGRAHQGIVMDACVQCFTPAANRQSRLMKEVSSASAGGSGRRLLPALAAVRRGSFTRMAQHGIDKKSHQSGCGPVAGNVSW